MLTEKNTACNTNITSKAQWTRTTGAMLTERHTGKMHGIKSISTSCLCNQACKRNSKIKGSICEHCFARAMATGVYKGTLPYKLYRNSKALEKIWDCVPRINTTSGYFRFEAFGDLASAEQVVNYFNMATANPHLKCALWTKNPEYIAQAVEKYGIMKPSNLNIIGSSLMVNEVQDFTQYNFIDAVFTVYGSEEVAQAHGKTVNCGARDCSTCGKCYEPINESEVVEIIELLK